MIWRAAVHRFTGSFHSLDFPPHRSSCHWWRSLSSRSLDYPVFAMPTPHTAFLSLCCLMLCLACQCIYVLNVKVSESLCVSPDNNERQWKLNSLWVNLDALLLLNHAWSSCSRQSSFPAHFQRRHPTRIYFAQSKLSPDSGWQVFLKVCFLPTRGQVWCCVSISRAK